MIRYALIAGAACLVLTGCERSGEESPQGVGTMLIPDAAALLELVDTVVIERGDVRTTLRRGDAGDDWRIDEFGGYPAAWESVAPALSGVANLRVREARTARADRHALIALDTDGPAPGGVTVRWLDGEGNELAGVVLGAAEAYRQRAARLVGEDQSWLVSSDALSPGPEVARPVRFVFGALALIPRGRVAGVRLERDDGSVLAAERDDWRAAMRVTEPAGASLSADASRTLEDALAYIPLFAAARDDGFEPTGRLTAVLFDGATVTLELGEPGEPRGDDATRWVRMRVVESALIGVDEHPNPETFTEWFDRETRRWHGWRFLVPEGAIAVFEADLLGR